MLTGKGQAQICGNQDAPRWRAQQRTGWKAGHWEPFIPSHGLVCFIHQLDQPVQRLFDLFAWAVADSKPIADIFFDVHAGEKGVALKYHAHSTLARRQLSYVLAVQNEPKAPNGDC